MGGKGDAEWKTQQRSLGRERLTLVWLGMANPVGIQVGQWGRWIGRDCSCFLPAQEQGMPDSAGKSQIWSRWNKVVAEGPQGERKMSGMDTGKLNGVGELWPLELAEDFWDLWVSWSQ